MAAFECDAVRIDRGQRLVLAALPILILGAVAMVGPVLFLRLPYALVPSLIEACGVLLIIAGIRRQRQPKRTAVRVRVDSVGLWLNGLIAAGKTALKSGSLVPGITHSVRLTGPGGPLLPIELEVAADTEGQDLLRALNLDVTHRVALFRVVPGKLTRSWFVAIGLLAGAVMGVVATTRNPAMCWLPVIATIAAVAMMTLARTMTLEVGADGLLLRRLGRRRFLSYEDVQGILREENGIVLVTQSGERIAFSFGVPGSQSQQGEVLAARDAVFARVEEARSAYAAARRPVNSDALLAPGTRTTREWMRAVSGLGSDVTYRAPALPSERLWRMVEDPATPATTRAGAALALKASMGSEERTRLHTAARASASPRLRVALECVAEEDASSLESALESLRRRRY